MNYYSRYAREPTYPVPGVQACGFLGTRYIALQENWRA
jgi:hypothetical protein